MSDIKINPEWFKKKKGDSFKTNDSKSFFNLDAEEVFEKEIAQLPEKGQDLIRLILSRNLKNIKLIRQSIWTGRTTPVSFYTFSNYLKIQSISSGLFFINLFNKGYFLILTDRETGREYSICEINKETMDALYPNSFKRHGKRITSGLLRFMFMVLIFVAYLLTSAITRTCSREVVKKINEPNREEIIEELRKTLPSAQKIENEQMVSISQKVNEHDEIEIEAKIKNLKYKQVDLTKVDLTEPQKNITNYYCSNSGMSIFRKHNIPMRYRYFSEDNIFLYEVFVKSSDCLKN